QSVAPDPPAYSRPIDRYLNPTRSHIMTKLANLDDLLLHELADLYDAEHQILKALPKMAKAANSDALRQAFELHITQTENQVGRLEQAFSALGKPAKGTRCDG